MPQQDVGNSGIHQGADRVLCCPNDDIWETVMVEVANAMDGRASCITLPQLQPP